MENYQQWFVESVAEVVSTNWYRRRPAISILDMGCDPTGNQLKALAQLTTGSVTGINIPADFPSHAARENAGSRVKLLRMDGMQLDFPDESFDLVVSANVLEHVPSPERFIREAARVLRPNGLCYMETAPVWTSARGHHLMQYMVAENIPEETDFTEDGSIIPEWGHLTLSRDEMRQAIGDKVLPKTRDYLLWYLYDSGDLNRTGWREFQRIFTETFPWHRLHSRPHPHVDNSRMPQDGKDDYLVYGFKATCRKLPPSWLRSRLCWRLRKLGL
jgi:ubiquinone/menaquinone biosynthesis C-methylase UbiE